MGFDQSHLRKKDLILPFVQVLKRQQLNRLPFLVLNVELQWWWNNRIDYETRISPLSVDSKFEKLQHRHQKVRFENHWEYFSLKRRLCLHIEQVQYSQLSLWVPELKWQWTEKRRMLGTFQLCCIKSPLYCLSPKYKTCRETHIYARKLEWRQNKSRTLSHLFLSCCLRLKKWRIQLCFLWKANR